MIVGGARAPFWAPYGAHFWALYGAQFWAPYGRQIPQTHKN